MPMLRQVRTLGYFGVPHEENAARGARPAKTNRAARRNAAREAKWPLRRRVRKEPKVD